MNALENFLTQEIQSLREMMVTRLQVLDDLQSDTSDLVAGDGKTIPTPILHLGYLSKVVIQTPVAASVCITEKLPTKRHSNRSVAYQLEPIHMKALKGIK